MRWGGLCSRAPRAAVAVLLCCALLVSGLSGCGTEAGGQGLRAAVLYYGDGRDWEDAYSQLEQSLLLNLSVEAVDMSSGRELGDFDLLYPDISILSAPDGGTVAAALMDYVKQGGFLFLENGFHSFFPLDFLGAAELVKLDHCPTSVEAPELGGDLAELQEIISDFALLYPEYTDFERLSAFDYGWAIRPDTAQALITENGLALYALNRYGKGEVLFTNPLLPNAFSVNGFSLTSRSEKQVSLANTTASANQLLRNAFAGYLSKQRYGYAAYRVFGNLGSPSMSWELHVEDIDGMHYGVTTDFSELCREALQIPSFSIIRNPYRWFARMESVSYALNQDSGGGLAYEVDYAENAYSSGTHVVSGDQWLTLAEMADTGSYFIDYPEYTKRAYPCVQDMDGDGTPDLLCGSDDGYFYFYRGLGFDGRFQVSEAQQLTDPLGAPLSVGQSSAPALADVDGDGILDLVSGAQNGKLYWFSGGQDLTFTPRGILLDLGIETQSMPAVGDLNGDGAADLLVGSNSGALLACYGGSAGHLEVSSAQIGDLSSACAGLGAWLAPAVADLNGDGAADLAVGTFDGYVARLLTQTDGSLSLDGYFTGGEGNYKGNENLKFGNNCVPCFADLNGDGNLDLLAGCLEYGIPYPIDSPYFPYREELQRELDYIKENDYYASLHFYTNVGSSPARDAYELSAHKAALESYGMDFDRPYGTNQHTWHLSSNDLTQSFRSMWDAGILWNSGFEPPRSSATPQVAAENVMALPFFLTMDGEETLLIQNCAVLLYQDETWETLSAKYDMPLCVYYHCDMMYKSDADAKAKIARVGAFQTEHGYNFMREDQLMQATAAAYHLSLTTSGTLKSGLTLTPGADSTDFALYNADYQNSGGVRISFAASVDTTRISPDADVWYWRDGDLYVGLNRPVTLRQSGGGEQAHLMRVNLPATIEHRGEATKITFLDGGMMQVAVSGPAKTSSDGWTATQAGSQVIFTKYGPADVLEVLF